MAAIFLIALYLGSCNKQEHGVGVGLFDENNVLGAHLIDTFQIQTYSKENSSFVSSHMPNVTLGFYKDPFFGNTKAEFYSQFEITNGGIELGDTLTMDSIVLYLKLGSGDLDYYGIDNKAIRVDVKLISKSSDFNKDSVYYTDSSLPTNRESLLDPDFDNLIQPNFTDTVFFTRDSDFQTYRLGVMRIKLKNSFGQKFLDQSNTSTMESNENFLEEYKGIYVSIIGEDGESIVYINMADFGTSLFLYYKKGSNQTLADHRFLIDNVSAHFNAINHDYEQSGSLRLNAVIADSTIGNKYFFNQAGGGFEAFVQIPDLKIFSETHPLVPVNKAEIIIPIEEGSTKDFEPPKQLFIFRITDEGKEEPILDYQLQHTDGFYNAIDNQYRFNVVKHVQALLKGEFNDNGLVIKTINPGNTVSRVILNGPEADPLLHKPMKFHLYYSSLIN
jgi:hypothetical protein